MTLDQRMIGEVGIAYRCAYGDATAVDCLDLIERQAMNVDHLSRTLDIELHQIQEGRAAGEEADRRGIGLAVSGSLRESDRLIDIRDAFKLKGFHVYAPLKLCDEL